MARHFLAAALLMLAAGPLSAQAVPASCRALVDAEKKGFSTPSHAYATEASSTPGQPPVIHETIISGGVSYILHKGKWRRSPLTPADMLKQLEQNLDSAKAFSCERNGTDLVNGTATDVYLAHETQADFSAVARTWVARSSGLVLKTEEDIDTGGPGGKQHISIRYDYDNVRAPAGADGP